MSVVDAKARAFSVRRAALSLLLTSSLLGVSACSDGNDPGSFLPEVDPNEVIPPVSENTIAETLLMRSDYQVLLRLIEEADLTEMLQGDNAGMRWTVFAPPDEAFENESFELLTLEQRNALVKNHIASGQLASSELMPGPLPMIQGAVEIVPNQDGTVSVGGATIIAGNREMSNGVIHYVDAILEPL